MSDELTHRVQQALRDVPDFPKPGILFKDITPVLQDAELFAAITNHFAQRYEGAGITRIVGIESRGFIFGAALANQLGIGLSLVRKPGKLPYKKVGVDYALEYGTDRVEMHVDALEPTDKVVLIDDLLATGGTAAAAVELIDHMDAQVHEIAFLIELGFLQGGQKLIGHDYYSVTVF